MLPEISPAEAFAAAAQRRGVALTPAAAFATSRQSPNAVRLCIGTPRQIETLERGLGRVLDLLAAPLSAYWSVI